MEVNISNSFSNAFSVGYIQQKNENRYCMPFSLVSLLTATAS